MTTSTAGANDDNVIFEETQAEVARLQLQHEVLKADLHTLIFAPIDLSKPGLRILDQATADGTWLRDLRTTALAQHEYVGTDIADAYFPRNPPADTSYHHQSMTEPWPHSWQGSFDLVHSRLALPGAGTRSVGDVVAGLAGLLKRGGYIQLMEIDAHGVPGNGVAMQMFEQVFRDMLMLVTQGRGMELARDMRTWLEAAGLTEVYQEHFEIVIGARAQMREQRVNSVESMVSTAVGLAMLLKKAPPMTFSADELDAFPEQLRRELEEVGGAFEVFVAWGRRP